MNIKRLAFSNCSSLKFLDFENCNCSVNVNISKDDKVNDCIIIVPNSLKDEWIKCNSSFASTMIKTKTEYLTLKISHIKNYKIILGIIYLRNALQYIYDELLKDTLIGVVNQLKNYISADEIQIDLVLSILTLIKNTTDRHE